MSKEYLKKSILEGIDNNEIDIVIQNCDCFGKLNKGICRETKEKFKEVSFVDSHTSKTPVDKLGDLTSAVIDLGSKNIEIFNIYSIYKPDTLIQFSALDVSLFKIVENYESMGVDTKKIILGISESDFIDNGYGSLDLKNLLESLSNIFRKVIIYN